MEGFAKVKAENLEVTDDVSVVEVLITRHYLSTLTHTLAHSLTHSLTHSLNTISLTLSPPHTHSLITCPHFRSLEYSPFPLPLPTSLLIITYTTLSITTHFSIHRQSAFSMTCSQLTSPFLTTNPHS